MRPGQVIPRGLGESTLCSRLRTAMGIDTTTPPGRLLLQVLGAFAEFERETIRERVIAGVACAQAAGKHCGRPRVEVSPEKLLAARQPLDEGWTVPRVPRTLVVPRG